MDKAEVVSLLKARLEGVEQRLAGACRRAGRHRSEVTLVAVTKTLPVELAALAADLGLVHLGENRPQELWKKAAALPKIVHWHLIGHLQRNKIEPTLPLVELIHSVDSVRLLQALDDEAARQGCVVSALLEVNAGGEASKHGFTPEEAGRIAPTAHALKQVRLQGLMAMAPLQSAEACRPIFAFLRELRDRLQKELAPTHAMHHLSMGMTNDFEVAVEEGATLVRLGTVLFEGLTL